jgi:hypothetical protein
LRFLFKDSKYESRAETAGTAENFLSSCAVFTVIKYKEVKHVNIPNTNTLHHLAPATSPHLITARGLIKHRDFNAVRERRNFRTHYQHFKTVTFLLSFYHFISYNPPIQMFCSVV